MVAIQTSKKNQCDNPLRKAESNEFFNTIGQKRLMLRSSPMTA
ncbi:hypothetical protein Z948_1121 [Sulfitobacter donghicola DSW-25 = KCTC 12864 = JCM 14565]|nr:hypothetical protein Z948_1121 [Sulfitobacter donghicola DSW-25 = KCTC 12864 = JCM 14565]